MNLPLKKIVTNRFFQIAIAFVAGGFVVGVLLPEKIVIKKETEIVYKDKIIEKEVIKYVDREVIKEVKVTEKVKVVKRKETFPDGHIIEEEIYESESEQVARIVEQEKERYAAALRLKEQEFAQKESYLKEHLNPKRFTLFGGGGTRIDDPTNYYFVGGADMQLWGPFIVGVQATSRKDVGLTFGIRF